MKRKMMGLFAVLIFLQLMIVYSYGEAAVYGNKVSEKQVKVSSAVTYLESKFKLGEAPNVVNLLDINLNDPYTKLEIGVPNPLNSLKTTTAMATENHYSGHRVLGAVNASFFLSDGMPANLLAANNQIINYGILGEKFESPTQNSVAFGISKEGKAIADYYNTNLSFTVNGKKYPIDRINNVRDAEKTVLYTPAQETTGTNQYGVEIIVTNSSKDTKELYFGDRFTGTISRVTKKEEEWNSAIPKDGFVISTHGKLAEEFSSLPIGSQIEVELSIDSKWQDAQFILAAGPLLVKDGQINISMPTNSSFVNSLQPRTAVAVDSTGTRVFLVTVDGRLSGYSNGTSLKDLASYLISLGASAAINLDGGGSTTMSVLKPEAIYPVLVNTPSYGERSVSAILQAIHTGVYLDVSSRHWAINEIVSLNTAGLVKGYPNGTFKPDLTITRAETATIIARALNLTRTKTPNFTDVKANHYAYNEIGAAAEKGIFIGREQGHFYPDGKLTRAEMATVLNRAYHLSGTSTVPFTDVQVSNWAYNDIQTLVASNLIVGYPDNTFKPNQQITRAEFVTLLDRVLKR